MAYFSVVVKIWPSSGWRHVSLIPIIFFKKSTFPRVQLGSSATFIFLKATSATVSLCHIWLSRSRPSFRRPLHLEAAFRHFKVFTFSRSFSLQSLQLRDRGSSDRSLLISAVPISLSFTFITYNITPRGQLSIKADFPASIPTSSTTDRGRYNVQIVRLRKSRPHSLTSIHNSAVKYKRTWASSIAEDFWKGLDFRFESWSKKLNPNSNPYTFFYIVIPVTWEL